MNEKMLFYAVCACAALSMAVYHLRRRRRMLSLLTGAVTGIAALLLTEKLSPMLGLDISLNPFNLIGSAVLGVPYSVLLIIMNFL